MWSAPVDDAEEHGALWDMEEREHTVCSQAALFDYSLSPSRALNEYHDEREADTNEGTTHGGSVSGGKAVENPTLLREAAASLAADARNVVQGIASPPQSPQLVVAMETAAAARGCGARQLPAFPQLLDDCALPVLSPMSQSDVQRMSHTPSQPHPQPQQQEQQQEEQSPITAPELAPASVLARCDELEARARALLHDCSDGNVGGGGSSSAEQSVAVLSEALHMLAALPGADDSSGGRGGSGGGGNNKSSSGGDGGSSSSECMTDTAVAVAGWSLVNAPPTGSPTSQQQQQQQSPSASLSPSSTMPPPTALSQLSLLPQRQQHGQQPQQQHDQQQQCPRHVRSPKVQRGSDWVLRSRQASLLTARSRARLAQQQQQQQQQGTQAIGEALQAAARAHGANAVADARAAVSASPLCAEAWAQFGAALRATGEDEAAVSANAKAARLLGETVEGGAQGAQAAAPAVATASNAVAAAAPRIAGVKRKLCVQVVPETGVAPVAVTAATAAPPAAASLRLYAPAAERDATSGSSGGSDCSLGPASLRELGGFPSGTSVSLLGLVMQVDAPVQVVTKRGDTTQRATLLLGDHTRTYFPLTMWGAQASCKLAPVGVGVRSRGGCSVQKGDMVLVRNATVRQPRQAASTAAPAVPEAGSATASAAAAAAASAAAAVARRRGLAVASSTSQTSIQLLCRPSLGESEHLAATAKHLVLPQPVAEQLVDWARANFAEMLQSTKPAFGSGDGGAFGSAATGAQRSRRNGVQHAPSVACLLGEDAEQASPLLGSMLHVRGRLLRVSAPVTRSSGGGARGGGSTRATATLADMDGMGNGEITMLLWGNFEAGGMGARQHKSSNHVAVSATSSSGGGNSGLAALRAAADEARPVFFDCRNLVLRYSSLLECVTLNTTPRTAFLMLPSGEMAPAATTATAAAVVRTNASGAAAAITGAVAARRDPGRPAARLALVYAQVGQATPAVAAAATATAATTTAAMKVAPEGAHGSAYAAAAATAASTARRHDVALLVRSSAYWVSGGEYASSAQLNADTAGALVRPVCEQCGCAMLVLQPTLVKATQSSCLGWTGDCGDGGNSDEDEAEDVAFVCEKGCRPAASGGLAAMCPTPARLAPTQALVAWRYVPLRLTVEDAAGCRATLCVDDNSVCRDLLLNVPAHELGAAHVMAKRRDWAAAAAVAAPAVPTAPATSAAPARGAGGTSQQRQQRQQLQRTGRELGVCNDHLVRAVVDALHALSDPATGFVHCTVRCEQTADENGVALSGGRRLTLLEHELPLVTRYS